MAKSKPAEFAPEKQYVIGRFKVGAPTRTANPEFLASKEVSGERILRHGVTTVVDLMDSNPLKLDRRYTWYVYEREDNGLKFLGADTPRDPYTEQVQQPSGGLSDEGPLFEDHRKQPTPAYREQIDLLTQERDHLRESQRVKDEQLGRMMDRFDEVMDRMEEAYKRVSSLEIARVTAEQKLASETALMRVREEIRKEERERAEEEATAEPGLADVMSGLGLDMTSIILNLPTLIQGFKAVFSSNAGGAQNGAAPQLQQPATPNLTPAELARLQQTPANQRMAVLTEIMQARASAQQTGGGTQSQGDDDAETTEYIEV